jgi:hypothetical protein
MMYAGNGRHALCGPVFGNGDLFLGCTLGRDAELEPSWNHVGCDGVYECPAGQDGTTLFTGAEMFRAAEVEV